MARDGTNRGGARIGAGRKRKSLEDKILEGQALKPEKNQMKFKVPTPKGYLSAMQKDGSQTFARRIYRETYEWLESCGCAELIPQQQAESFAQVAARHIQCEEEISKTGFLTRHPTTGEVIASPLIKTSLDYLKAAQQIFFQIQQVVKENSTGVSSNNNNDAMERILQFSAYRKEVK